MPTSFAPRAFMLRSIVASLFPAGTDPETLHPEMSQQKELQRQFQPTKKSIPEGCSFLFHLPLALHVLDVPISYISNIAHKKDP